LKSGLAKRLGPQAHQRELAGFMACLPSHLSEEIFYGLYISNDSVHFVCGWDMDGLQDVSQPAFTCGCEEAAPRWQIQRDPRSQFLNCAVAFSLAMERADLSVSLARTLFVLVLRLSSFQDLGHSGRKHLRKQRSRSFDYAPAALR
jgi:hypothetical protein